MKQYKTVEMTKEVLEKVLCNCCGKEITKQQGYFSDFLHVEKQWGYFSQKDGRKDAFDLCENCYDQIVKSFVLPIEQ